MRTLRGFAHNGRRLRGDLAARAHAQIPGTSTTAAAADPLATFDGHVEVGHCEVNVHAARFIDHPAAGRQARRCWLQSGPWSRLPAPRAWAPTLPRRMSGGRTTPPRMAARWCEKVTPGRERHKSGSRTGYDGLVRLWDLTSLMPTLAGVGLAGHARVLHSAHFVSSRQALRPAGIFGGRSVHGTSGVQSRPVRRYPAGTSRR